MMKILRAAHLGMCFGVRDAVHLALHYPEPVTVLGDLVHNENVLKNLRAKGVVIKRQVAQVSTPTVMITAHGASDLVKRRIVERGLRMVEATCPLVHRAHQALRGLVAEGCHPVIVGQPEHVEVRGLTEDLAQYSVVLSEHDLDQVPSHARYGVISQTTQPVDRVRHLVQRLQQRFPHSEIRWIDTVCGPTKQRQHAALSLAKQCDVVVVVGGAFSNNTRELVATCQRYCPAVHHVQGPEDLRPDWFVGAANVGLTAGTSTPDHLIQAVDDRLKSFAQEQVPASPALVETGISCA